MRAAVPLLLILVIAPAVAHSQESTRSGKLKGLLITGGCCHDYAAQKQIITQGLSQRMSIDWDVVHEGGSGRKHKVSVYADQNWVKKYDLIVHNECFGAVADDMFVQSIAAAHHAGVPAVFIHCSLHSYRSAPVGADAWRELVGVTSTSHESKRPVVVRRLVADHPIMIGFPAEWKTPNGELYKIEKHWPNCEPLAEAWGEDTGKSHTVIWTNKFGRAKVFGTSLGHHNETMNTDVWLDVVARGSLWCCDKLQADGRPAAGYEGTGKKPIVIKDDKPAPQPDPAFPDKKKVPAGNAKKKPSATAGKSREAAKG